MKALLIINGIIILCAMMFWTIDNGQETFGKTPKPSFNGSTGWINSPPLNLSKLQGKVVLIDFCTYTCINWRRTLPYLSEWASKYRELGLVVIGVHTPEFPFEKINKNVSKAVDDMKISYPVVMDNNFNIWNSFHNRYWPALYLIDINGQIRYKKFGEGDYQEIELMIQQLLRTTTKNISDKPVSVRPQGYEAQADWQNLQSPENYGGYRQTQGFVSPGGLAPDQRKRYVSPNRTALNQWGLSGEWVIEKDRAHLIGARGKIIYRFHARDLHLIMGPADSGDTVRFRVLLDGKPPGPAQGLDIDSDGNGMATDQRMYQLIRQQAPITDREFQIEFFGPEIEIYSFTFG